MSVFKRITKIVSALTLVAIVSGSLFADDIHKAVSKGDKDKVKELLKDGYGTNLDAKDDKGRTPAHILVAKGDKEILIMLLEDDFGADLNIKDKKGQTPLHLAAADPLKLEIVEMLIDYGADVNAKDKNMMTPLHVATINNNVEIANLLLKNQANVNAKAKCVESVYSRMGDYSQKGNKFFMEYMTTPLHLAAWYGNLKMIKLLVKEGADTSAKDYSFSGHAETPLVKALWKGNHGVKMLIANGAEPSEEDAYGNRYYTQNQKIINNKREQIEKENLYRKELRVPLKKMEHKNNKEIKESLDSVPAYPLNRAYVKDKP